MKLVDNIDHEQEVIEIGIDSQCTSEFWINNFDFEIFYDLSKNNQNAAGGENPKLHHERHINDLPVEILSKIFSYCSVFDLLTMRSVSSKWEEIINSDKSLWNNQNFSAVDLDVKTTTSLIKQMPLLRSVEFCVIQNCEEMTSIIQVLCKACWDIRRIKFPEACKVHPTGQDVHSLGYYFPKMTHLQISTKQKLTQDEVNNLGDILSTFDCLKEVSLFGFYWHYNIDLVGGLLCKLENLVSLKVPSIPGLKNNDLSNLMRLDRVKSLTINIVSLTDKKLAMTEMNSLEYLKVIESSSISSEKLRQLKQITSVHGFELNLSNAKKTEVINFFKDRNNIKLKELVITNCNFSDELLKSVATHCSNVEKLAWLNPKHNYGEMTDVGLVVIIKNMKKLRFLDIKSRSLSNVHYKELASLKSLNYARINGMKVPGCC